MKPEVHKLRPLVVVAFAIALLGSGTAARAQVITSVVGEKASQDDACVKWPTLPEPVAPRFSEATVDDFSDYLATMSLSYGDEISYADEGTFELARLVSSPANVVPEPSTIALALLGLAGMVAWRRRCCLWNLARSCRGPAANARESSSQAWLNRRPEGPKPLTDEDFSA